MLDQHRQTHMDARQDGFLFFKYFIYNVGVYTGTMIKAEKYCGPGGREQTLHICGFCALHVVRFCG